MSRYIDADELLKYTAQLYDENGVGFYAVGTGNILRMPTADVVEVVRCEDCCHWQTDWIPTLGGDEGCHYCEMMDCSVEPNNYCAYGYRRDVE